MTKNLQKVFEKSFGGKFAKLLHCVGATKILREIKIDEFRVTKSCHLILTKFSEALNFEFNEFLHFWKNEIYQINKVQSPEMAKMADFEVLDCKSFTYKS